LLNVIISFFVTFGPAMKKAISIFFLSIYLLSTTEAYQLLKLPVVFEHFDEHRALNKHISFMQFLEMHYLHGDPQNADYDRDMQLPFKSCNGCISPITASLTHMQPISVEVPVEMNSSEELAEPDSFIPSTFLNNIWQPPRA